MKKLSELDTDTLESLLDTESWSKEAEARIFEIIAAKKEGRKVTYNKADWTDTLSLGMFGEAESLSYGEVGSAGSPTVQSVNVSGSGDDNRSGRDHTIAAIEKQLTFLDPNTVRTADTPSGITFPYADLAEQLELIKGMTSDEFDKLTPDKWGDLDADIMKRFYIAGLKKKSIYVHDINVEEAINKVFGQLKATIQPEPGVAVTSTPKITTPPGGPLDGQVTPRPVVTTPAPKTRIIGHPMGSRSDWEEGLVKASPAPVNKTDAKDAWHQAGFGQWLLDWLQKRLLKTPIGQYRSRETSIKTSSVIPKAAGSMTPTAIIEALKKLNAPELKNVVTTPETRIIGHPMGSRSDWEREQESVEEDLDPDGGLLGRFEGQGEKIAVKVGKKVAGRTKPLRAMKKGAGLVINKGANALAETLGTGDALSRVLGKGAKWGAKGLSRVASATVIGDIFQKMGQGQGGFEAVINKGVEMANFGVGLADFISEGFAKRFSRLTYGLSEKILPLEGFRKEGEWGDIGGAFDSADVFDNSHKWNTNWTEQGINWAVAKATGTEQVANKKQWTEEQKKLAFAAENSYPNAVDIGLGKGQIEDVEALTRLEPKSIEALLAYEVWSDKDMKILEDIRDAKISREVNLKARLGYFDDGSIFGFEGLDEAGSFESVAYNPPTVTPVDDGVKNVVASQVDDALKGVAKTSQLVNYSDTINVAGDINGPIYVHDINLGDASPDLYRTQYQKAELKNRGGPTVEGVDVAVAGGTDMPATWQDFVPKRRPSNYDGSWTNSQGNTIEKMPWEDEDIKKKYGWTGMDKYADAAALRAWNDFNYPLDQQSELVQMSDGSYKNKITNQGDYRNRLAAKIEDGGKMWAGGNVELSREYRDLKTDEEKLKWIEDHMDQATGMNKYEASHGITPDLFLNNAWVEQMESEKLRILSKDEFDKLTPDADTTNKFRVAGLEERSIYVHDINVEGAINSTLGIKLGKTEAIESDWLDKLKVTAGEWAEKASQNSGQAPSMVNAPTTIDQSSKQSVNVGSSAHAPAQPLGSGYMGVSTPRG